MDNLSHLISRFYKLAIDTPDWVPPHIKNYLNEVKEVKKDPRLKDFREPVDSKLISNKIARESYGLFGETIYSHIFRMIIYRPYM